MSGFDWFLAIPLVIGAVIGFRKGLLLEVISLLALILGVIGGLKLLTLSIPLLEPYFGAGSGLLPFAAFLLVLIAIVVGVHFIGRLLKMVLHLTPLGIFDNVLGAVLGALKWCLALSLLLYVADMAGMSISHETAKASVVYPFVAKATPVALDIVSIVLPFVKALVASLKALF
ncbi:MAG: CvpA family protein [Hymenobacteraceae bacterium]|nr:CvpA family protein [Hymenobacteraceae bacterium]MDX5397902.1 CvpA family protein [Hymenobacteraceae bacterium]MDX5513973.1 CvpA family protein [Hymenobacteraceae bacterium]